MTEKQTVTLKDETIERIAKLSQKKAATLAAALLALATHGDAPQWIRNAAEAIYLDSVK